MQSDVKAGVCETFINDLAVIAGKESCELSEARLREAFGLFDNDAEIIQYTDFIYLFSKVKSELLRKDIKAKTRNSTKYSKFKSNVTKFRDSLKHSVEYMNSKEGYDLLMHWAERDDEVSIETHKKYYAETYNMLKRLYTETEQHLYSSTKRGKPSIQSLYDFVYKLAVLYEETSGETFTLNK